MKDRVKLVRNDGVSEREREALARAESAERDCREYQELCEQLIDLVDDILRRVVAQRDKGLRDDGWTDRAQKIVSAARGDPDYDRDGDLRPDADNEE